MLNWRLQHGRNVRDVYNSSVRSPGPGHEEACFDAQVQHALVRVCCPMVHSPRLAFLLRRVAKFARIEGGQFKARRHWIASRLFHTLRKMASTDLDVERFVPRIQSVHEAIQHLLQRLRGGEMSCAEAMAVLCNERAAELATLPVPAAAAVVKSGLEAGTYASANGDAAAHADALTALLQLLACPPLREVAIKASRLKSLAILTIEEAAKKKHGNACADAAALAVVGVLRESGVNVTTAGTLEAGTTPLILALQHSFFGVAQLLLDAGADVNGCSPDGDLWPLSAAAASGSDAGMAWLLEHGASVTLVHSKGESIVHTLTLLGRHADHTPGTESGFSCRWLRRVIAAEPSLLETRTEAGRTPLTIAAFIGSEDCVGTLLELGADIAAVGALQALSAACAAAFLPVVHQLIAAGAASAAALPPGSPQACVVATCAVSAALRSELGCGICTARCGGRNRGNCADGLDILRAVLAAGVREAVDEDGYSLGSRVGAWLCSTEERKRISAGRALTVLQALHAAGVDVLARGPADEQPALHAATAANAPAVVRWLVAEAGAPLEERDSDGDTPLLVACDKKAWAAALALLAAGARVDIPGGVVGTLITTAEWARSLVTFKHRGVKLAVAARAREHAAEAGRVRGAAERATRGLEGPPHPCPSAASAASAARYTKGAAAGPRAARDQLAGSVAAAAAHEPGGWLRRRCECRCRSRLVLR